jgi:adenine deaminase
MSFTEICLLRGTDTATGLLGTSMGLSLHQELSLYVDRCGLTPIEALRSATSTTARRFRLDDRGILARGRRADILMVKGDPTKNISLTLEISGIWRGGVALSPEDGVQSASLENLSGPVLKPRLTELEKGVSKEVTVSQTHVLPDFE